MGTSQANMLDLLLYFCNHGNMKRAMTRQRGPDQRSQLLIVRSRDVLIGDASIEELKHQAADGCFLCELDRFDEEDWD